jgi:hypothetical protein
MYTARLKIQYRKPVLISTPIKIIGYSTRSTKRLATSRAEIIGPDGEILVEAEAILINIPDETINNEDLELLGWKVYDNQEIL